MLEQATYVVRISFSRYGQQEKFFKLRQKFQWKTRKEESIYNKSHVFSFILELNSRLVDLVQARRICCLKLRRNIPILILALTLKSLNFSLCMQYLSFNQR